MDRKRIKQIVDAADDAIPSMIEMVLRYNNKASFHDHKKGVKIDSKIEESKIVITIETKEG